MQMQPVHQYEQARYPSADEYVRRGGRRRTIKALVLACALTALGTLLTACT